MNSCSEEDGGVSFARKNERDVIVKWHRLQASKMELMMDNAPPSMTRSMLQARADAHRYSADCIEAAAHWTDECKAADLFVAGVGEGIRMRLEKLEKHVIALQDVDIAKRMEQVEDFALSYWAMREDVFARLARLDADIGAIGERVVKLEQPSQRFYDLGKRVWNLEELCGVGDVDLRDRVAKLEEIVQP